MSKYLINKETLDVYSNNAKRLADTSDEMSVGEMLEIYSRTQGTVKTTGEYKVRALNTGGEIIKSGMYDTGEVFALPQVPQTLQNFFTTSDGTTEVKTIATFQGWNATSPLSNSYVIVDDAHVDVATTYKPAIDNSIIIVVNITEENTNIGFNCIYNSKIVDWGDGATDTEFDSNLISHTYTTTGKYMIVIQGGNNFQFLPYVYNPWSDECYNAIEGICIPKSLNAFYFYFAGLTNLKYIILEDGILLHQNSSSNSIKNCTSLKYINIPSSMSLIESMFCDSNLERITLPYGITEIPYCTFYNCTSLTDIVIPNSVTSIGVSCFYNCTSLTDIVIPNSVTSIGASCFYVSKDDYNMTKIVLPSVTYIGEMAFSNRFRLRTIVLKTDTVCQLGVNSVGEDALFGTLFHAGDECSIYVPDSLVDAYKSTECWKKYAKYIKPLSEYIE